MAEIKVTTSEVRAKAEQLRQTNALLKSKVQSLVEQEGVLSGMWEGDAKNAFHASFNSDKAQWDNFSNLIDQYCTTLDNIASEYDAKEAANVQIASTRTYT